MLSVKGIYENGTIHFLENFTLEQSKSQFVIVTFVDAIENQSFNYTIKQTINTDEIEMSNADICQLLANSRSFDFLNAVEENIYSDNGFQDGQIGNARQIDI